MLRGNLAGTGVTRTTNPPPAASFTMMAWFYPVSFNSNDNVYFVRGTDAGGGKKTVYNTDPGGPLDLWNGSGVTSGSSLTLLTWVHLAFTYDGTTALLYKNGVLDITSASATPPGAANVAVGQEVEASVVGSFDGRYGGILLYDVPLKQAEIRRQMQQIVPIRTANLNTFSPHRFLAEAAINYAGAHDLWTVTGTHTVEPGPPIPWILRRRRTVGRVAAVGHPAIRRFGGIHHGPRRTMKGVY